MIIYIATEYVLPDYTENATGYYSTREKAKEAVLARVATEYTSEEMKNIQFDEYDGLRTPATNWLNPCLYTIDEMELDEEMG